MKKQKDKKSKIDYSNAVWFEDKKWSIRDNTKRKSRKKESHPALLVGKVDGKGLNYGLTHEKKRGHHNNIELSRNPNPKDNKKSYIRDDIQADEMKFLKNIKKDFLPLPLEDKAKVHKLINKKKMSTRR